MSLIIVWSCRFRQAWNLREMRLNYYFPSLLRICCLSWQMEARKSNLKHLDNHLCSFRLPICSRFRDLVFSCSIRVNVDVSERLQLTILKVIGVVRGWLGQSFFSVLSWMWNKILLCLGAPMFIVVQYITWSYIKMAYTLILCTKIIGSYMKN